MADNSEVQTEDSEAVPDEPNRPAAADDSEVELAEITQDKPETGAAKKLGTPHKQRGPKALWGWLKAKPRRMVIAGILGVVVLASLIIGLTDLRYPVLGMVMTTSVQVAVSDNTTKQPVPQAEVKFGGASGLTDKAGRVTLAKVKPGHGAISVTKAGYSDAKQSSLARIFRGPTVAVSLKPNGIKVVANVTNLISAAAVKGVEVKSGEASAITDETGRAELSLPPAANNTEQKLAFSADGYLPAEVTVPVKVGGAPVNVKLVPSGKVYFQSNRTGRIDIYSSNLDGSGATVALAGTGSEDTGTGILPNITDPHTIAIVSSRDGRRGGTLHHDLFIFNTESQKLTKIDPDVEFGNYRAWIGNTLVYTKTTYVPYTGSCDSIKTYDVSTGTTATLFAGAPGTVGCATISLALSNGFIYSVRGTSDPGKAGLYMAKLTGTPKHISNTPSDTTVRRAKQTLLSEYYNYNYATNTSNNTWDSIDLGSFAVTRLPNGPANEASRYYNDSPDGNSSVFIEERDGKSELYLTDGNGGNEKKLTAMGSVNQFVQWYGNDYIVFSSTKADENALYVVSAGGGTPVKIADFYRGNQRTYGGGGNPYN